MITDEQSNLSEHVKAALGIGKTTFEVKTKGLFGHNDILRYDEVVAWLENEYSG